MSSVKIPKNILVPFDGSKPAEKAVELALAMAEEFTSHTSISILNVIPVISFPPPLFERSRFRSKVTGELVSAEEMAKELSQEMKKEAEHALKRKAENLMAASSGRKSKIISKVVLGYPTDEIIAYAKANNVDLIVMGNIGASGISKLRALGSVSRSVSERATCPVMIVH